MDDENVVGEELVLTPPDNDVEVSRRQNQATLVQVGTRWVTSDGRFHPDLAAKYVLDHARVQWVSVATLAKVFGGGNTKEGKRKVRRNMSMVFTLLLNHGEFLLYDVASKGRIEAVKLLDAKSDHERRAAVPQLDRMKQRHQITVDKYQKALDVIHFQDAV